MKTFEELKKDGILKNHNIPIYQKVQELFESGEKRVGVVQATGTGKSYLSMQWLFDTVLSQPGKHAIVLDPLKGIVKQFKELSEKLCREKGISPYDIPITFARYDQLKTLTDEEIKLLDYDYIVIDEFHGLGAEGRGTVTQKLLKANPDAKILGVTATPIRYLDKNRDMGDEIFGDNIVRGVNISEAIEQEILPSPKYYSAVYSYAEIIDFLENKTEKIKDKAQKELIEKDLAKAKRKAEMAEGLDEVFARRIQNKNGKFIAFCSDTAKMESLEEEIHNGLLAGVNKKVKVYKISYKDKSDNSNKIIKQFEEDKDEDCLKIMLAVDMFNEGIHIKDVDGCFLFRPTISPRIYLQQIGRVLNVRDDPNFQPVIFDIVNNAHCLDKIKEIFDADEKEKKLNTYGGKGNPNGQSDEMKKNDPNGSVFKIEEANFDLNEYLRDIEEKINSQVIGKEQWLAAAERYVKEFGNLDVPATYIEEKTELRFGLWIYRQKKQFREDPKSLDKKVFDTLLSLDSMVFDYSMDYNSQQRDKKIIEGVKAWPKDKQIPQDANSPLDEAFPLGQHISTIKKFKNGKNSSYSQELINQINEINPFVLMSQEEYRDYKIIEGVKAWPKNKQIPTQAMSPLDKDFYLGQHISCIRQKAKGNTKYNSYSQELIDQINEINPFALMDPAEYRDCKIIEGLKAWPKDKQIPQRTSSPEDEDFPLGRHIDSIKKQLNGDSKNKRYSQELIDQINEINPFVLMSAEEYRDCKIIEGVKAWPKNKQIPQKAISPADKDFNLGQHISIIKQQERGKIKNSPYSQELIDQINEINPFILMPAEEYRDYKIIEGVTAWPKNKKIPFDAKSPVDEDFNLGTHITAIRQQERGNTKHGSYSQELIDQINEINPVVLKQSQKDDEIEGQ